MFPAECEYHRASSVEEALSLAADNADRDTELIAGGHGLVPDMKRGDREPDVLVDISRIDGLDAIESTDDGVSVGPLVRHADLVDSDLLRRRVRVLAEAAGRVGDVQIRNRGTIGGNLADAESGADLPAAVLAADATLDVTGRDGTRTIPADEFFVAPEETALADGELLTGVRLPGEGDAGAYVRKTHPATGYALVGVAAAVALEDGAVTDARLATVGATERPRRLRSVEDALVDSDADDPLGPAVDRAGDDVAAASPNGDVHASGDYRFEILPTYVERALESAIGRAKDDVGGSNGGDGA